MTSLYLRMWTTVDIKRGIIMKQKVQKGFTLVELIVVMVLMGVLMTAVVMILRPSQNTFKNITNKAYEEQTALNISKLLNGSLRYATGVKIVCNDGTTPTAAEFDKHKNYIKLSNNYRASSVKGARGDFERGRIDPDDKKNGPLKRVASAITSETFDEYDFQFYIGAVNTSLENASMTIQLRAMPMEPATPEEKTIATSISKPNPSFVPYWEKYYDYSETFEFINMRHKDTINKDVTGINGESYELGPHVKGLGDMKGLEGFIDPLKKDNTIWIFYTNPQEAELSSGGGAGGGTSSATASGSGSTGEESNLTGTSSIETPEYNTSAAESGSEPSTSNENSGNGGNTNSSTDTQPGNESTTSTDSNSSSSSSSTTDSSSKPDTFGNVELVFIGAPYDTGKMYNFSSGMKYSSTVGDGNISVTASGTIVIDGAASNDHTNFNLNCPVTGGFSMSKNDVWNQPNRTFYFYNGTNYGEGDGARAKAQQDHDNDANSAPYTLSISTECNERNTGWDSGTGGHATFSVKIRVNDGFIPSGTSLNVTAHFDKNVSLYSVYSGGTGTASGDSITFTVPANYKVEAGNELIVKFNVQPADCNIVGTS